MLDSQRLEVSTIRTMLRIMRYDELLAKATCKNVVKAVIKDRKLTDEQAEELTAYVDGMERVS